MGGDSGVEGGENKAAMNTHIGREGKISPAFAKRQFTRVTLNKGDFVTGGHLFFTYIPSMVILGLCSSLCM